MPSRDGQCPSGDTGKRRERRFLQFPVSHICSISASVNDRVTPVSSNNSSRSQFPSGNKDLGGRTTPLPLPARILNRRRDEETLPHSLMHATTASQGAMTQDGVNEIVMVCNEGAATEARTFAISGGGPLSSRVLREVNPPVVSHCTESVLSKIEDESRRITKCSRDERSPQSKSAIDWTVVPCKDSTRFLTWLNLFKRRRELEERRPCKVTFSILDGPLE